MAARLLTLILVLCFPVLSHAAYVFKHGKLIKSEEVATLSVQEHYSALLVASQQQEWEEVIHQAVIVVKNFATTPFAEEAYYYLGLGYFYTEELEMANRFFTKYLKKNTSPKFFEETIQYKFKIAERYKQGAKKHVFGIGSMPKWLGAYDEAIAIYDEVITALPHHDLSAYALFGKAALLLKQEEYKSSIETYQILIRRFPKHPLAAEGYIGVAEVYLEQSQQAYPDQDFLDLAEINMKKFRQELPGEEKLSVVEGLVAKMKEVYASDLYDTARFYERTKKNQAAYIYYTRLLAKYPETTVAVAAQKRLEKLAFTPEALPTAMPAAEPTHEPATSPLLDLKPQGLTVEAP